MTDLNELLELVRGATGPDRELDLAMTNAFDLPEGGLIYRWGMQALEPGSMVIAVLEGTGPEADNPDFQQYVRDRFSEVSVITPRPYTASIDAALALVERVLPGRNFTVNPKHCELRHPKLRGKDAEAFGATAPLAILAALLQALNSGAKE